MHLLDLTELSVADLEEIIHVAGDIRQRPRDYADRCRGRILATLFYEPSTRTQMSFQAAMLRLGGQVIGFGDAAASSVAKGETLKDTVRVVSGYADLIALRHPVAGAARAASLYSRVPVINAGDGGHLHPTQTLADLVTLFHEKGACSGLTIGVCGDLKYGRTVHSLLGTMACFPDNRFVLISADALRVPAYLLNYLAQKGCSVHETESLTDALSELDVLYMTRVQRERFADPVEYERLRNVYVLDKPKMALARPDMLVLHPLPRTGEIAVEVDDDPRALYFEQTVYGLYARMALILRLLETPASVVIPIPSAGQAVRCANPLCITAKEPYVPAWFEDGHCAYCEEAAPGGAAT